MIIIDKREGKKMRCFWGCFIIYFVFVSFLFSLFGWRCCLFVCLSVVVLSVCLFVCGVVVGSSVVVVALVVGLGSVYSLPVARDPIRNRP